MWHLRLAAKLKSVENIWEISGVSRLDFRPWVLTFDRHDGHDVFSKMEVMMEKRIEAETNGLIEMGAAVAETKGSQRPNLPDEVAGQFLKMPGLAQD